MTTPPRLVSNHDMDRILSPALVKSIWQEIRSTYHDQPIDFIHGNDRLTTTDLSLEAFCLNRFFLSKMANLSNQPKWNVRKIKTEIELINEHVGGGCSTLPQSDSVTMDILDRNRQQHNLRHKKPLIFSPILPRLTVSLVTQFLCIIRIKYDDKDGVITTDYLMNTDFESLTVGDFISRYIIRDHQRKWLARKHKTKLII